MRVDVGGAFGWKNSNLPGARRANLTAVRGVGHERRRVPIPRRRRWEVHACHVALRDAGMNPRLHYLNAHARDAAGTGGDRGIKGFRGLVKDAVSSTKSRRSTCWCRGCERRCSRAGSRERAPPTINRTRLIRTAISNKCRKRRVQVAGRRALSNSVGVADKKGPLISSATSKDIAFAAWTTERPYQKVPVDGAVLRSWQPVPGDFPCLRQRRASPRRNSLLAPDRTPVSRATGSGAHQGGERGSRRVFSTPPSLSAR